MRAPLFANTVVKAPATFSRKDDNLTMLEAEYRFSLKKPLSGTWAKPVPAEEASRCLPPRVCTRSPTSWSPQWGRK